MMTDYLKAHLVCARQTSSEATEKYDYNKMKVLSYYKFFILKFTVSAI